MFGLAVGGVPDVKVDGGPQEAHTDDGRAIERSAELVVAAVVDDAGEFGRGGLAADRVGIVADDDQHPGVCANAEGVDDLGSPLGGQPLRWRVMLFDLLIQAVPAADRGAGACLASPTVLVTGPGRRAARRSISALFDRPFNCSRVARRGR